MHDLTHLAGIVAGLAMAVLFAGYLCTIVCVWLVFTDPTQDEPQL